MSEEYDPRIYLAGERTLLAWVRTGITVSGLGFVVARFGLFLRLVSNSQNTPPGPSSHLIGVGLIFTGAAAVSIAALHHSNFWKSLKPELQITAIAMRWAVCFAVIISMIGMALGGYLMFQVSSASLLQNSATQDV